MSFEIGSFFRPRTAHPLAGCAVLQIIPELHAGAAAQAAIDIAGALGRLGANALVASRGGAMVSELQAKGGVFAPFPAHSRNPVAMALNMRRLARLIEAERVDIVHARSRAAAWVAYGATRLTRTPFVTTFQTGYDSADPFAVRYNSVMARGDAILAESSHAAKLILARYPAAEGKIRIVRRGVDCRAFSPTAVAPERVQLARRQWGLAPDDRIVLLADFTATKNPQLLIDAAARFLAGAGEGAKFILAGEDQVGGRPARDIDRAIIAAQLQGLARRVGPVTDLPAALLAASVVVAAGHLGGAAIEAQAMGTPVIIAGPGASRDAVLTPPECDEAQRTGWLAEDAVGLAAALAAALQLGATARDRLSLRARAHVEGRFSLEQSCNATLEAYCAARPRREAETI